MVPVLSDPLQRLPGIFLSKVRLQSLLQAEEFVSLVAGDRLDSLLRHASNSCPQHTLGILIEGLEHHLSQRQRREFQVLRTLTI